MDLPSIRSSPDPNAFDLQFYNDPFLIQMDMDMNDAGLDFPPKVGLLVGLVLGYETQA